MEGRRVWRRRRWFLLQQRSQEGLALLSASQPLALLLAHPRPSLAHRLGRVQRRQPAQALVVVVVDAAMKRQETMLGHGCFVRRLVVFLRAGLRMDRIESDLGGERRNVNFDAQVVLDLYGCCFGQ